MDKTRKTFYKWLIARKSERSPIGDLAHDAANDPGWPRIGTLRALIHYLNQCNACYDAIETAQHAWNEFEQYLGHPPHAWIDSAELEDEQLLRKIFTWRQREAIFIRDGRICVYCGQLGTILDHFISIALGGADELENLVTSCYPCNRKKHKWYWTRKFPALMSLEQALASVPLDRRG